MNSKKVGVNAPQNKEKIPFEKDDIHLNISGSLCAGREPEDSFVKYSIEIAQIKDNGAESVAGRMSVRTVEIDLYRHTVFEVFDSVDSDTMEYVDLFRDNGEYKKSVLNLFDETILSPPHKLLLIDKIEILPKARGRNLAAIAVGLVEKHLAAGAMLAVVKPFPLQHGSAHRAYKGEWSRRMRYDLLEDDVESGKKKLQWLYAKMGYRPLRKTPFMLHVLY